MPRGWRTTLAAWTCCSAADWPRTPRTAAPSPGYSPRRRGAGSVTAACAAARCVSTLRGQPTPVRRSAREQIEFADTLLLNKCDLVGPEEAARLERVLAALNPAARCVRCVRCEVPVQELLHSGRFRLDRAEEARPGIILFHPAIFCGTMLVAAWALADLTPFPPLSVTFRLSQFPEWSAEVSVSAPSAAGAARHEHRPETEEFGISTRIFTARRPFHPVRLWEVAQAGGAVRSLLRSKVPFLRSFFAL